MLIEYQFQKKNHMAQRMYLNTLKTKIKIYADNMITNFLNKRMSKEKAQCKANKKYYPQTLLEECKYVQEKIKN